MIVIGGEGSLIGTVLGTLVWQLVPKALSAVAEMSASVSPSINETWLNQWQTQLTLFIFGLLVLLVMVFQPDRPGRDLGTDQAAFVRWPYTT